MGYWVECNFCAVKDRSIAAVNSSASRAELHADPVPANLHQQAAVWQHARFAVLMAE